MCVWFVCVWCVRERERVYVCVCISCSLWRALHAHTHTHNTSDCLRKKPVTRNPLQMVKKKLKKKLEKKSSDRSMLSTTYSNSRDSRSEKKIKKKSFCRGLVLRFIERFTVLAELQRQSKQTSFIIYFFMRHLRHTMLIARAKT